MAKSKLKEAFLWEPAADGQVQCRLCSWRCLIGVGKTGYCKVRKNIDGKLYSLNYGRICAANIDPIEKKPLFHFLPGSKSFSIAAMGCNFRCEFCQNWQISQVLEEDIEGEEWGVSGIIEGARRGGCESISYTYTEPTIFMEICDEVGRAAKERGLKNVFVSNGYMTVEAIEFAKDWLDAINVDLKAFSDIYYKKLCKARLEPVLKTITHIARNTNIWMELTTLLVPGQNDSDEELRQLVDFIAGLNPEIPWHISRFFPQYHLQDSEPTPVAALVRAYEIGKRGGLKYIYVGNIPGDKRESTHCPGCEELLIGRAGYVITANKITGSACPKCGEKIPGMF